MKRKLIILTCWIPVFAIGQQKNSTHNIKTDTLNIEYFELGEVVISAEKNGEKFDRISYEELIKHNKFDAANSLNIIPGISLSASGQRNETMVTVRGFDLRAVPVYMDGIPVYVPYDGYVDLARFTTFDLSAIDVSKGFSSMSYGPNSLGGAINLISRKPSQKFEYDGALGMINTNGYRGNINLGSNLGKFFIQGGYSYLHRDSYRLSKSFETHNNQGGGERDNSYRTDQKFNFKVGWTPNKKNEVVLGYINQKGEKGTPIYAGKDTLNSLYYKPRYWQWPRWNKETVFLLSKSEINDKSYIKTRLYHDKFINSLQSFDDDSYTTQHKPYAFESQYNDYTYGGNIEYGTLLIPRNEIKVFLHYKSDIHRERNIGDPVQHFIDNTLTAGLESVYKATEKLSFIPGFSYNSRNNERAEDYNDKTNVFSDYPTTGASSALNGQLGVFYKLNNNHKLSTSFARKTRFATIKDRYSYRMGSAIPNPGLKPESSENIDLSYNGRLFKKLNIQASVYHSQIKDGIQFVDNAWMDKSQMQNTGKSVFKGGELALSMKVIPKLNISASYSYIERKNLENPEILYTDVPKSKLFFYAQYQHSKQLSVLASVEYNSERISKSYGTSVPAYVLSNLNLSAKVAKNIALETGINNLFDVNYSIVEGYPEEGRNIFITLRFFNPK